ncbi:MAG: tRNA pseudouridine(54/55) synthase Pus10 [Planctomycetota bacterium]|nr:tRNA pseudouridine(54/55) synthase Pus10 [Planctomycetota bacterium]
MNQPPKAKVFLEGRYRKLTRDLPQTVFYCPECKGHPRRRRKCERCEGYGKLTRDSVQELVAWVAGRLFGTRKNKFHGAGREDVDVRMLGRGRPFVLELIAPKNFEIDLAELEAEINRRNEGRLEIQGLHWSEKSRIRHLKESPHAKEYEALVKTDGAVAANAFEELLGRRVEVTQRTPGRVAHRRADLERMRWVEYVGFEPVAEDRLRVRLLTEHGTYVKEVLSGEGGKTRPSLGDQLGVACECLELDVLAILDAEGNPEPEVEAPPSFGAAVEEVE